MELKLSELKQEQRVASHKALRLELEIGRLPIAAKFNRRREELHQKLNNQLGKLPA